MELYKKYLAERDGASVFYTDDGFVTYSIIPSGECYFSEVYVVPEKRNTKLAWKLWNYVLLMAKLSLCTHIIGSVDVTTRNWQLSEKLMIKLGFVAERVEGNMKFYRKQLN